MNEKVDVHKIFAEYFPGTKALAYALSLKLGDGHICVDIESYRKELELNEQPDGTYVLSPEDFDKQCIAGNYVTNNTKEFKPFVIYKDKAYLQRYFNYETSIIKNIQRLAKINKFKIITGGPGTGKTFSVSTELVSLFQKKQDLKVALAAPTGKAAVRVNESIKNYAEKLENKLDDGVKTLLTELKATTLHRLLGYQKDSVFFKYNEKNKLTFDVVIIDECSMIDGAMMAKLLNAISDNTMLYLLGDKDQLASVEAGSLFGDICRAKEALVLENKINLLNGSRRFEADKGIGKFSSEVIAGTFSDISLYADDLQLHIDTSYNEKIFEKYALEYIKYVEEDDIKEALKRLNDIRFLCVTRENKNSVTETNKRIERILKSKINNIEIFNPKEGFYHNQPIMITKNNSELGVYNGDVGLIRKNTEGNMIAYFEAINGIIKEVSAGYLNNYETVFAMTIHKSQGSEFDHVVVILPEKHAGKLLTRELLYTGVTRAKTFALIQSNENTLLSCIEHEVARSSGLQQRLDEETL
jgi:exodeoxyribonuclease V alpha subunit